jgi:hypothetical protein
MWALDNATPFAADRAGARGRDGAELWLVAVKGTYIVGDRETLELAPAQAPPEPVPRYRGKPRISGLLCESDLTYPKPATDVIVSGSAWAPGGIPVSQVDVSLKVGPISKTLRVIGDRCWDRDVFDIGITSPTPFESVPIIYERAFGGSDPERDSAPRNFESRNPIGVGFASNRIDLLGTLLPNIENPGNLLTSPNSRPGPVGFGPVARDWSPRKELAGTYDEAWMEERYPLVPLDFDDRFYQCAPRDQQVEGYLRGGERVELCNLTPRGYLAFTIPKVWLTFRTRIGNDSIEHRSTLQTVLIEPDLGRVTLVWLTMLPCHGRDHKLYVTRIAEKPYRSLVNVAA